MEVKHQIPYHHHAPSSRFTSGKLESSNCGPVTTNRFALSRSLSALAIVFDKVSVSCVPMTPEDRTMLRSLALLIIGMAPGVFSRGSSIQGKREWKKKQFDFLSWFRRGHRLVRLFLKPPVSRQITRARSPASSFGEACAVWLLRFNGTRVTGVANYGIPAFSHGRQCCARFS